MSVAASNPFTYRTFYIVTGASKGLGKQTAIRLAKQFQKWNVDNCSALLVARNIDQLSRTKKIILDSCPAMKVSVAAADLTYITAEKFRKIIDVALDEQDVTVDSFEQAAIIHNAASMGNITDPTRTIDDMNYIQDFYNLNVTSFIVLNSVFLKMFTSKSIVQKIVVNITSICSLQAFKYWALYCSSKAARDMIIRTMALEEPDVRLLNYAPGPLDTDMLEYVRQNTGDPELRSMFLNMHEEKKELTPDMTLDKLLKLLEDNTYDSGAHIDYYDI